MVATTNDWGLKAAGRLHYAGVQIAAVADLRPTPRPATQWLTDRGIEVLSGHTIIEAKGSKQVTQALVAPLGREDEARTFDDLVVVSGGAIPATSLLSQAGARTVYDEQRGVFVLAEPLPANVYAAGEVAGFEEPEAIARSGERAGRLAAGALVDEIDAPPPPEQTPAAVPPPVAGATRGKCFACLCEDVTAKDIKLSIDEGYDSIELSKRYTTVTMGPCQGRMCQLASVRLMAQETGQSLQSVGTTTALAPIRVRPDGRAGRPPVPAGQALGDPRPAPCAGRQHQVGWRLAARLRLRRSATRGARRPSGRRPDRRLHAGQAGAPRPGRRAVPRASIPTALPISRSAAPVTA